MGKRQFPKKIQGLSLWNWSLFRLTIFLIGTLAVNALTFAHETDQYTMPKGRKFAELGPWISDYMYDAIQKTIDKVNDRIARSLRDGQATNRTRDLQSPDELAKTFVWGCPNFWLHCAVLERQLADEGVTEKYPNQVVQYRAPQWIYSNPMLSVDLFRAGRLFRCNTIMGDGSYFGTDKILHFCHMGYIYFREYRKLLEKGYSEEEAIHQTVLDGSTGPGVLSENGWIGRIGTGVISNGDLATDYVALKFYRNLTEPVSIKGVIRPPILVRDGEFYRFNDQIRKGNNFFAMFVSDHWNEALNPSDFSWTTKPWVEVELRKRCDGVIAWYENAMGRPLVRDDFRRISEDLSTYYGEDYGHQGSLDEMVTIANVCFEPTEQGAVLARYSGGGISSDKPERRKDSCNCRCRCSCCR